MKSKGNQLSQLIRHGREAWKNWSGGFAPRRHQLRVWSPPGCFHEGDINAKYEKKDYIIHIWGSTKILKSLSEDYVRTKNPQSKELARKVMLAQNKLVTWDDYSDRYLALIKQRGVGTRLDRVVFEGPTALLCSEATAEHCHRRLAAEYLSGVWGDLEIVHL